MDSVGHSTSCMCEGWNPSSILGDREKQTVEASWQPNLGEKADWCFSERHCKGLQVELCLPAWSPGEPNYVLLPQPTCSSRRCAS